MGGARQKNWRKIERGHPPTTTKRVDRGADDLYQMHSTVQQGWGCMVNM